VADVRVGKGDLAGKGVYADRDFIAGEPVITFDLQQIDEAQYPALPASEYLFVHSYGGRRYLYRAPARFVNHSDEPSCFEDFDRAVTSRFETSPRASLSRSTPPKRHGKNSPPSLRHTRAPCVRDLFCCSVA
jgi:hypothetical protein